MSNANGQGLIHSFPSLKQLSWAIVLNTLNKDNPPVDRNLINHIAEINVFGDTLLWWCSPYSTCWDNGRCENRQGLCDVFWGPARELTNEILFYNHEHVVEHVSATFHEATEFATGPHVCDHNVHD